jgi:hypothetical protein
VPERDLPSPPSGEIDWDVESKLPASLAIKQAVLTAVNDRVPAGEPGSWQSSSYKATDGRTVDISRLNRLNLQEGGSISIKFVSEGYVGEVDGTPTGKQELLTRYHLDQASEDEIDLTKDSWPGQAFDDAQPAEPPTEPLVVSEAEAKRLLNDLAQLEERSASL